MIPPMTPVEMMSPGTAKVRVGARFSRRARASRWNADWKIRVGRKTKRTASGVTSSAAMGARKPTRVPSHPSTAPTTTSPTVKGILMRFDRAWTPAATTSIPTKAPTREMTGLWWAKASPCSAACAAASTILINSMTTSWGHRVGLTLRVRRS